MVALLALSFLIIGIEALAHCHFSQNKFKFIALLVGKCK